ncbi:MAG: hypothetical protein WA924_04870, partial [Burkholderiaceae bacterium]
MIQKLIARPIVYAALMALLCAIGCAFSYRAGMSRQADADRAAQLEQAETDAEILRVKNRASAAAGVRTERAQIKT